VLGWDDDDTPLHADYVAEPSNPNFDGIDDSSPPILTLMAKQWSEAFVLRHRHVIRTSEELADALAVLARRKIRTRIRTILRIRGWFRRDS
jgi:hypothetical protein